MNESQRIIRASLARQLSFYRVQKQEIEVMIEHLEDKIVELDNGGGD